MAWYNPISTDFAIYHHEEIVDGSMVSNSSWNSCPIDPFIGSTVFSNLA